MPQTRTEKLPRKYRAKVEQLYTEHKGLMLYVALSVCKNEEQAKDIVHSSFLRIIKHIGKIESMNAQETKGYIMYIVKNLALDYISMHEYKKTTTLNDINPVYEINSHNTEKDAINNLDVSEIMEKLEKLDHKYSFPVFHKYVLGYSISEIAKILDITVPNAKVRCHRGRLMLISLMEEGETHE